jgi:hypothetical protein
MVVTNEIISHVDQAVVGEVDDVIIIHESSAVAPSSARVTEPAVSGASRYRLRPRMK